MVGGIPNSKQKEFISTLGECWDVKFGTDVEWCMRVYINTPYIIYEPRDPSFTFIVGFDCLLSGGFHTDTNSVFRYVST